MPWSSGRWTSWAACTSTDGTELKVVTGIDDHSRFCVSAKLVWRGPRPGRSARRCRRPWRRYGVPEQILTDNGKVFTGRFGPGPAEVLFDRICRENGIATCSRPRAARPRPARSSGSTGRCARVPRRARLRLARRSPRPSSMPGCRLQRRAAPPEPRHGGPAARFALAGDERAPPRRSRRSWRRPGARGARRVGEPSGGRGGRDQPRRLCLPRRYLPGRRDGWRSPASRRPRRGPPPRRAGRLPLRRHPSRPNRRSRQRRSGPYGGRRPRTGRCAQGRSTGRSLRRHHLPRRQSLPWPAGRGPCGRRRGPDLAGRGVHPYRGRARRPQQGTAPSPT